MDINAVLYAHGLGILDITFDDNSIPGSKIKDISILGGKLANSAVGATQLADGSVTNVKIADGVITNSKLAANMQVGDNNTLLTTAKASSAAAINELFTSVSNGKINIADAITGRGNPASGSETFAQLAAKITQLIIASGNAGAAQLLSGFTGSNSGGGFAGGMPNNGSPIWTPGTADIFLSAGYFGGGQILGDPDLIADNIRNGINIFGVPGNLTPGTPGAKGRAPVTLSTQTPLKDNRYQDLHFKVSGLTFHPSFLGVYYAQAQAGYDEYGILWSSLVTEGGAQIVEKFVSQPHTTPNTLTVTQEADLTWSFEFVAAEKFTMDQAEVDASRMIWTAVGPVNPETPL